jgi:hypothetical protein
MVTGMISSTLLYTQCPSVKRFLKFLRAHYFCINYQPC